jgi:hypothetical protein
MMQESPMQFHPGAGRHQGNRVKAFAPVPQALAPVPQAFAPVSQDFAPVSWPDLVRPPTTFCVDPRKVPGNRASSLTHS